MSFSPSPALPARLPPNLLIGFLLNFALPGSGFTYIDQPWWHLGWALAILFSFLIGLLGSAALGLPVLIFLPMLAFLGMHAHYFLTYQRRFSRGTRLAGLENTLKWGLIAGHLVLNVIGIVLLGILAAVVLPGLLNARTRAQETAVNVYMRSLQSIAYVASLNDRPYTGPCAGLPDAPRRPDTVQTCEISTADAVDAPHVMVTTTRGSILTRP